MSYQTFAALQGGDNDCQQVYLWSKVITDNMKYLMHMPNTFQASAAEETDAFHVTKNPTGSNRSTGLGM